MEADGRTAVEQGTMEGRESGRAQGRGAISLAPKIFICYRREDNEGFARAFKSVLGNRYGDENIFMDIDDIPPGEEWKNVVHNAVSACDVLIALIGKRWLTLRDRNGKHRLEDPLDPVRLEIQTALNQNLGVIPALLRGARMPASERLPEELARLHDIEALRITDDWDAVVAKLIAAVDDIAGWETKEEAGPIATSPPDVSPPAPPPPWWRHWLVVAAVVFGLIGAGVLAANLIRHRGSSPDTALHDYLWKAYRLVQQSAGQRGTVNAAVQAKDAKALRSLQESRTGLLNEVETWQVPPAAKQANLALEQALHYSAISDGNWASYAEGSRSLADARAYDRDKVHPEKFLFDRLYNHLLRGVDNAPPPLPSDFLF